MTGKLPRRRIGTGSLAFVLSNKTFFVTGPQEEPVKLGQQQSGEHAETNGHNAEHSSRPPSVFSVSQVRRCTLE